MRGRPAFDLAALRRSRLHAPAFARAALDTPVDGAIKPQGTEQIFLPTRRDVVKLGFVASALSSSLGKVAGSFASETVVGVTCRRNRAALLVNGDEALVIDAKRFAGPARVMMTESPDGSRSVRLMGARWPGTSLSADMTLTLDDIGKLDIDLALGGFRARVPAKQWLLGKKPARSRVELATTVCRLDTRGEVVLRGSTLAEFTPDLRLTLLGTGIGNVSALGSTVRSGHVELYLADEDDPSAFTRAYSRRSIVRFQRGDETWKLDPDVIDESNGSLRMDADSVETLTLESAESGSGRVYRALIADSSADAAVGFTPGSGSRVSGEVALAGVRLVAAYDGTGDGVVLLADITPGARVRAGTATLHLAGDGEDLAFEATRTAAASEVSSAPRVKSIAVELEGAIASPLTFPASSIATVSLGAKPAKDSVVTASGEIVLAPGTQITVLRPEDGLVFVPEFWYLKLVSQPSGGWRLMPTEDGWPLSSSIHYIFTRQSINEQAIPEAVNDPTQPLPSITTPVKAQLSGYSRLSFGLTWAHVDGIPYTTEALLDWSKFNPILYGTARNDCGHALGPVTALDDPRLGGESSANTYLEMPYRLWISPNEYGYWHHAKTPVIASSGYTPLWHTRLRQASAPVNPIEITDAPAEKPTKGDPKGGSKGDSGALVPAPGAGPHALVGADEPVPEIRAIWAQECLPGWLFGPETTTYPLSHKDRLQLVQQMQQFGGAPVKAPLLMLTPLGGYMDVAGEWDPQPNVDLVMWKHRAALGRDNDVRVAYGGYLYPTGHKAVLMKVTERRFANAPAMPGSPTSGRKHAYLFQSQFIVVLEPTKDYTDDGDRRHPNPFDRITMKTLQTPKLDQQNGLVLGIPTVDRDKAFWPHVSGKRFAFEMLGTDSEGREVAFETPLVFVAASADYNRDWMELVESSYRITSGAVGMRGQTMAFAPAGTHPQSTALVTKSVTLGGTLFPDSSLVWGPGSIGIGPHFWPKVSTAEVYSEAIASVTGSNAAAKVAFYGPYATRGFAGSVGQVYLELVEPIGVGFPAQRAGGVASPNMVITGLSRSKGPVCGRLISFDAGDFNPADYFPSSGTSSAALSTRGVTALALPDIPDATLLGCLPLGKILEPVGIDSSPTITVKTEAQKLVTAFDWKYQWPAIATKAELFESGIAGVGTASLQLRNEISVPLSSSAGPTRNTTEGTLQNFALAFKIADKMIVRVAFAQMKFASVTGGGTTLDPQVYKVEFGEQLALLAKLAQLVNSLGSSSASMARAGRYRRASAGTSPGVSVSADGVEVTESMTVPDFGMGLFSMTNLSLGFRVFIPFSAARASVGINFGTLESPFGVAVYGAAGFGSFAIALTTQGIEMLDATIQAGAQLSVNFGVASGSVSVAIGFHFRREGEITTYEAFVRMSGRVSVLGLISVSITLVLALVVQTVGSEIALVGRAELEIKVKVAFFSKTVTLSVERTIPAGSLSGSALAGLDMRALASQSFTATVSADAWEAYCLAFSAVPAGE
jgi:hypothetical protein